MSGCMVKHFPRSLDHARVSQAININPGHRFGVSERETFGDLVHLFLLEVGCVIVYDGDKDREVSPLTVDTE